MLPARTVNGATGVFYGPREHPNIFQGTGQHWLIFQQGNKPDFWGSASGNLENSSFSMHWPYAFVIVRRQSQCFEALLIFKRMLMSENWLEQDVRILQFMHWICDMFCVRRYQQFWTLMVNGNAYNQCLQSKFVNCCHTMSWKGWFDQVGSLVLFNHACRKSMTGFSHAPLETAFSLHRKNTTWLPWLFHCLS